MTTTQHETLLEAVSHDHREMYVYYDQYVKAAGNPDQQERWARQLIWEVARHAISEEIVVYPLMEKYLGQQGKQQADVDRADHQKVKDRLYRIESLAVGTPEHSALLQNIMTLLRPHNENEEQKDLPLLEKAIGADESRSAAASFERTKLFVPTRPHPNAPDQPPFETLAALMSAPLDKIKDMFAKFPTSEQMKEVMEAQSVQN